ncbi:hypothetical protein EV141_0340 [Microcella putealis]|uniref:Uncharacterized protein n=1 Tax=Microcella putealis TaxID=337005 RepID=A0A4Q7LX42_9MICO|nr:hypothetical protein [Microcella putealis]RZS59123.1 hypothetical protein EV141_0340 [Microcella putealis]TQM24149.1 hypothetical protein BJ957_1619 [Microcella putealis]
MSMDATHTGREPKPGLIEKAGIALFAAIAGLSIVAGVILIGISIFNTGSIDLGGHS